MTAAGPPRLDRWGRTVDGSMNAAFRALYHNWFRVEWQGLEHVPQTGGALLVSNHAGLFPVDGGIVTLGMEEEIGRTVYSLAHHGFWRVPFIGPALSRTGGVTAHPDNAQRLLTEDKSLVLVMPEGQKGPTKSRDQRYKLQRFGRGGFVETALRAGVPIVPIVLAGTEDTTPTVARFRAMGNDVPLTLNALLFGPLLGMFLQLPAKIRVRVLPPVRIDEPANLDHYPLPLLMDSAETIREQMQGVLDEMLADRRDIWRG